MDRLDTILPIVQEDQQLAVILQQTLQGMIRCVGRQWGIRRDLWIAFTHMHMHMER